MLKSVLKAEDIPYSSGTGLLTKIPFDHGCARYET